MPATQDEKKRGARLDQVDARVLKHWCLQLGLPTLGTTEDMVRRMVAHQTKHTPRSRMADCDKCGGECDVQLPVCPYCGTGDEEPNVPDPKKTTTTAASINKALAPAKAASPGAVPATAATPAAAPSTSIVPKGTAAKGAELSTEKLQELEQRVAEVQKLRRDAVVCYWKLGRELYRIYEGRLYNQRIDAATGSARYKSWSQFCTAELDMSPTMTYKIMEVAIAFSEEDVARVGVTKLGIVVKLPDAERAALLEKAKGGVPGSKLAQEVRELAAGGKARATTPAAKAGRTFKGGAAAQAKGRETAAAHKNEKAKGKQREVTAAALTGRVTLPLMGKPKTKGAEPLQAQSLDDEPTAVEQLLNDVLVTYKVVRQAKGLALVVDRKRREPQK